MSHITGGGFTENVPRVLPKGMGCEIDASKWTLPPVFKWLMEVGEIEPLEMARTFNNGVGMVVVVAEEKVEVALKSIHDGGEKGVFVMGRVTGEEGVKMLNLESW